MDSHHYVVAWRVITENDVTQIQVKPGYDVLTTRHSDTDVIFSDVIVGKPWILASTRRITTPSIRPKTTNDAMQIGFADRSDSA